MVVHYTTIEADRSEVRVVKQCCGHEATTLPAQMSTGDQPESTTSRCHFQALVFRSSWAQSTAGQGQWKLARPWAWQTGATVY